MSSTETDQNSNSQLSSEHIGQSVNTFEVKPSKRTAYEASEKDRCPVELAIRIIGGKWKPIILWHLREDKKRFGELKREIHGITVKMLAQQLREMEQDGLILRKMFYEVPPRVEYSLTEIGRSLEPVLSSLCAWGTMYREKVVPKPADEATILSEIVE